MRPRLLVLAAAVLFSTGGAAIKSTSLTAWQVASFRSGIAALAVLLMLRGARRLPDRATWLVGVVYAATLVFFVFANKNTTAANAIYLQGTAPLYILLAAPFVLRERVSRADIVFMAALGLGLGAFFLGQEPARATALKPALGNVAALASGLTWAATVMGLRWLGRRSDDPTATQPSLVAGNVLACVLTLGLALLLSSLSVHFRDIRDLLGNALTLWLFATPIIYPYTQAQERYRWLLDLNPFTHLAMAYQAILFAPGPYAEWRRLAVLALVSVAVFFTGYAVFDRLRETFAEEV